MDATWLHFLIGILAGAIPVTIIFVTLYLIRKKRETKREKTQRESHEKTDLTEQLKSVKEERVEKKGIKKTKN